MITLLPAYGRDYKTKKDAEKDFRDGKDFIFAGITDYGRYCSISDFRCPKQQVKIRFNNMRKFTVVNT